MCRSIRTLANFEPPATDAASRAWPFKVSMTLGGHVKLDMTTERSGSVHVD
jgi:hypothetical protein